MPCVAEDIRLHDRQAGRMSAFSGRCLRIVCGHVHQHTYLLGLLRPRRKQPHSRRAAVQAQRNSVVRRSRTLPPHRSLDNRRQRLHQAAARPVPKGIKRALAALTDEHKIAAKPDLVDSPIRRRCTPTLFPAILGLHPSYPINLTGPVSDRVAARASKLLAPSAVIVMQQLTMIL